MRILVLFCFTQPFLGGSLRVQRTEPNLDEEKTWRWLRNESVECGRELVGGSGHGLGESPE